jgi:membrane-bound metal-dependent hydrolase YbcI (DUF457 family)
MPLHPTLDGGRWQPTTVVTEREPDSWTQALHQGACGSVRRRPSRRESRHRPRSPARDWPSGQQARLLFAVTAPPRPRGLPLTPSRWRTWRRWRIERNINRQQSALRRAAWLRDQHARLDAGQAAARAELERWQRELLPAYQRAWQQVYRQTRSEGPPRPSSAAPAWWRKRPSAATALHPGQTAPLAPKGLGEVRRLAIANRPGRLAHRPAVPEQLGGPLDPHSAQVAAKAGLARLGEGALQLPGGAREPPGQPLEREPLGELERDDRRRLLEQLPPPLDRSRPGCGGGDSAFPRIRELAAGSVSLLCVRNTTHELVGVGAAVAASRALELEPLETVAAAAGAIWGSWLPDADRFGARVHRRGRLARRHLLVAALGAVLRLPLVGFALLARHRGLSHTLAACGLLAVAAALLAALLGGVGAAAAAGCAIGYCAHVLADACTPSGVRLRWPVSRRRVWLVPRPLRIQTGSLREALLAVAAATVAVALVVL